MKINEHDFLHEIIRTVASATEGMKTETDVHRIKCRANRIMGITQCAAMALDNSTIAADEKSAIYDLIYAELLHLRIDAMEAAANRIINLGLSSAEADAICAALSIRDEDREELRAIEADTTI